MIYVTGDIHGNIFERFNPEAMPGEETWTENDKIIVLGDMGLVFYPKAERFYYNLALERKKLEYLESKPYEILFIDGNHENFDRLLNDFPDEERYGQLVGRIGKNIFWLRRGRIYTIENKTFFCMGGAYSIDKRFREEGISWWPQESPSEEEFKSAKETLISNGRRVDYILTHTCPLSLIPVPGCTVDPNDLELTGFLDRIWHEIEFRHWYFGHWHTDEEINEKATAMYKKVLTIE